jgi:predicted nucleic acid-binding protein
MLVIADTSPLHDLVLIEHTDVLPPLFGRVIVPPVVEEAERCAFAVMGTLRVLELASERGLLDFAAAITKLEATSFHMPAQLVQNMRARDATRKRPT